jgi:translation initiation factor 2B subunit (eIF-2B alpha/beta/delta family)
MRKFSKHLRKFFGKVQRKRASFRIICASSAPKWCKSGRKAAGNLQKYSGFEQKFEKVITF